MSPRGDVLHAGDKVLARPAPEPNLARTSHIAPVISAPTTPVFAAVRRPDRSPAAGADPGFWRRAMPPPARKPTTAAPISAPGEARASSRAAAFLRHARELLAPTHDALLDLRRFQDRGTSGASPLSAAAAAR